MKTMILVPTASGLLEPVHRIAAKAAKARGAILGVCVEKALKLHSEGVVGRVVVVVGARVKGRMTHACDVYNMLVEKGIDTWVADGEDWGIRGQKLLTGDAGETYRAIIDLC